MAACVGGTCCYVDIKVWRWDKTKQEAHRCSEPDKFSSWLQSNWRLEREAATASSLRLLFSSSSSAEPTCCSSCCSVSHYIYTEPDLRSVFVSLTNKPWSLSSTDDPASVCDAKLRSTWVLQQDNNLNHIKNVGLQSNKSLMFTFLLCSGFGSEGVMKIKPTSSRSAVTWFCVTGPQNVSVNSREWDCWTLRVQLVLTRSELNWLTGTERDVYIYM